MIERLHKFFRGKSVFVTGHTGFKGSWLSMWLAHCGAHVHGYSLPPATNPSLFEQANVRQSLASHTVGDVRDLESLHIAMRSAQPSIVFHLAAQPLVRRSYREPVETFQTNAMGTVHVLEAVRMCPSVKVCLIVTTDKCYENREWIYPYRETDPLGGHDPYSASKACAEIITASYRSSFLQQPLRDISVSSARAGNVIGGGDFAEDRIIPDCIRALQANQSILVRNPEALRPWQHLLEPLHGYMLLAWKQWQDPAFSDAFNFGPLPSSAVPVKRIVEEVIATWGSGSWHTNRVTAVHEAGRLSLDVSKAMALLNWSPRYDVTRAVRETVNWYARWHRGEADARCLCLDQIHEYERLLSDQPEDGANVGPEPLVTA